MSSSLIPGLVHAAAISAIAASQAWIEQRIARISSGPFTARAVR
jgi:hypothetical protein